MFARAVGRVSVSAGNGFVVSGWGSGQCSDHYSRGMEPLSLFGVATAVGKLLLHAYRLRDDLSIAGVLDTSDDAVAAWEKLHGALTGRKNDPVTRRIANKLSVRLKTDRVPQEDLEVCQVAADNVAALLEGFAKNRVAVLEAARNPEGFPKWAMNHGGRDLLAMTPPRGVRFFGETLAAAASAFGELAPFSPRFVPTALNRVLDQLDSITEQLGPMAEGIEDVRHQMAPLTEAITKAVQDRVLSPEPTWPIVVGRVPDLASAFQRRPGLRTEVERARQAAIGSGEQAFGVVLTQVLSGGGGVGKSQLAASFAREALEVGTDLVVWVFAESVDGIVTAYAQAAGLVQAAGATGQPEDAESDAAAFLQWSASTQRSWLIVLDDITDPQRVIPWWPTSHEGTGWVLATTRSRDQHLFGAGRRHVDISIYSKEEAAEYLRKRLAARPSLLDADAGSLAKELGYLPLALSHAAAYMLDQRVRCGTYLEMYLAEAQRLDALMAGDPDGHDRNTDGQARAITSTLLLAATAAAQCEPVGLARAALDLCAVLDPNGHPEAMWSTEAVTNYLAGRRAHSSETWIPVTAAESRRAVMALNRFGLITVDEEHPNQAIQIHAVTARSSGNQLRPG
jgi:hypothetical protein